MGVLQSRRLSETLLTDLMWLYRLLENTKSPFCCHCSPPFSQSRWRPVRSASTSLNRNNMNIVLKLTPLLLISTGGLKNKWEKNLPAPAGWGVSDGHEGTVLHRSARSAALHRPTPVYAPSRRLNCLSAHRKPAV